MNRFWLNLRLFMDGAILSYIAMFYWLQPQIYLASKIFLPVGQLLFFTLLGVYGGTQNAAFYVIGNSIQLVAVSGIYGVTMSIGGERWTGTLQYLFASPANRLALFGGRALVHILDGMLGVAIGLICGILLFRLNLSRTDPLALILTILIATISTSGLGLVLGCLSLVSLNVWFFNNLVYFLLLVFCGVNVPLSVLPNWMQAISYGLPLTRGIAAARQIVDGASIAQVAPLLGGELLIGLVYIAIGYSMFRWFEFQAKRYGTLEAI